jgi:hypothetical protein
VRDDTSAYALGGTIKGLAASADVTLADIAAIEAACEARNAIAHRVAEMAPTASISASELAKRTEELRRHVCALTVGDNLVSRWCYEIEENEPAPKQIQEQYPGWIVEWVFGDDGASRG